MRRTVSLTAVGLGCLLSLSTFRSDRPGGVSAGPTTVGPATVIRAIEGFLEAMDQGDVEALEAALAAEDHCAEVIADEASGLLVETQDRRSATFYEVSVDGQPFAAASTEEFVRSLEHAVAPSEERSLGTSIRSIRANCLSEACSIAVVEFERRYVLAEGRKTVPMRATALLRYSGGSEPPMRIYHWHSSPAGEPRPAARHR